MFYIIRIIFIVIVVLPLGLIEIEQFRRQIAKGKKYTKPRYYVIIYSITLSVFLLSALSFIPFEASFIRFDTVEDALKYKWIDTQYFTIHYEDDCAFAVRGTSEIYALDRDENGFGFVNYNSKRYKYYVSDYELSNNVYDPCCVYHKNTNKTFYLVSYGHDDTPKVITDNGNIDLVYFTKPETSDYGRLPIFFLTQEYAVCEGEPSEAIILRYGDLQETLIRRQR